MHHAPTALEPHDHPVRGLGEREQRRDFFAQVLHCLCADVTVEIEDIDAPRWRRFRVGRRGPGLVTRLLRLAVGLAQLSELLAVPASLSIPRLTKLREWTPFHESLPAPFINY